MKYFPEEPYTEATTGPDDALPGAANPYFLKAGEGRATSCSARSRSS